MRTLHIYALINTLACMRTSLDINDRLMAEAKSLAARRGVSFKALVEEALRERLHARADARRVLVELPTYSGSGLPTRGGPQRRRRSARGHGCRRRTLAFSSAFSVPTRHSTDGAGTG